VLLGESAGRWPKAYLRHAATTTGTVRAFGQFRAAASTTCARSRSRQHVFAPRTLSFSVLRCDAVSVTGTAAGGILVSRQSTLRRTRSHALG
jgi:hypothetical protein